MKNALIDCCFAKKAKRDLTCILIFCSISHTGPDADLAADDAVAAVKFKLFGKHMHRAAFAADTSALFAVKLGHHALRRHTFDHRLDVVSIGRDDHIGLL